MFDSFVLHTLEAAAGTTTGTRSSLPMILLLVVMVVGMYFLMIRPQRKQQKRTRKCGKAPRLGMKSRPSAALWAALSRLRKIL